MTDFLDRLEAELHVAAQRRTRPRRPRVGAAVKVLAVATVIALVILTAVRVVDHDAAEQPAKPTPTPTPTARSVIAVATSADAASLDLFAARLTRHYKLRRAPHSAPSLADPSLGTVVLYRPGEERLAGAVADEAGIDDTRPLTPADERRIHFGLRGAPVVVIFGADLQEPMLRGSKDCEPGGHVAGGALQVCLVGRPAGTVSGILVGGRRLPVDQMPERGHWRWAAASPDGKTILAQWTGECEVPQAFLIDASGGRPRGFGRDTSLALGWTTDGRAIVFRPAEAGCGTADDAGVYLVTPRGEATRIAPTHRASPPDSLPAAVEPRSVDEVLRAAGSTDQP